MPGSLTALGTNTVNNILANVGEIRILDATATPAHRGDISTDLLGLDYITDFVLFARDPVFAEIGNSVSNLPDFSDGDMAWGDFNSDGDLDLAIVGNNEMEAQYQTMVFINMGDSTFTPLLISSNASNSNVDWGDFDNDGDLDLLSSGILYQNNDNLFQEAGGFAQTDAEVYFIDYDNDGDLDIHRSYDQNSRGGFYENINGLADVFIYDADLSLTIEDGDNASWGDYDNDGDKDLIVIGGGGSFDSYLYRNDNGTFVDWQFDFDATAYGQSFGYPNNGFRFADIDWADYDNDGDLDLLICGEAREEDAGTTGRVTIMYKNNGPDLNNEGLWLFEQTEETRFWPSRMYEGVWGGAINWADYDNDGQRDFLVSGSQDSWSDGTTNLYMNNGSDIFQQTPFPMRGVGQSAIAVGDYDNDGDLDFAQFGYFDGLNYALRLYQNQLFQLREDLAPSAPGTLSHFFEADTLILSWEAGLDDSTPADGLTYNVRVGTGPGDQDIVAAHTMTDGTLLKPFKGNAESARIFKLVGLAPDTEYYWSVQAIDATFKGSLFAEEQTFNTFPPAITIFEPNGGETFIVGDTTFISWTVPYTSDFRIEYTTDAGSIWNQIVDVPQTSGNSTEAWIIPNEPSNQCWVRIFDLNNQVTKDTSDAFFTINQPIVPDETPPAFISFDVDPETIVQGETLSDTVSVKVEDESAIAQVVLFYKEAGAANYISIIMTFDGIDEYTALIPIDSQNEKGIQLYATAEDVHGNLGTSDLFSIRVITPYIENPSTSSGSNLEDYSLFSIPLILDDPTVENFLDINLDREPDGEWYRLYAYQNGSVDGFIEYDGSAGFPDLLPGRAFFIIIDDNIDLSSGAGTTVDASGEFEIVGLQPGWNLIGHPFNFPVAFDSVYAWSNISNQEVAFDLWEYNGVSGWRLVDSGNLEPWKGYALFQYSNDNNQSFFIPPVAAGMGKSSFSTSNNSDQEWMIQIEAINGGLKSTFNYIGQLNNASDGLDRFDLVSPPAIANRVSISFSENSRQVTDIRHSNEQGPYLEF